MSVNYIHKIIAHDKKLKVIWQWCFEQIETLVKLSPLVL